MKNTEKCIPGENLVKKLCQIGKFPNLWDQLDKRLGLSK